MAVNVVLVVPLPVVSTRVAAHDGSTSCGLPHPDSEMTSRRFALTQHVLVAPHGGLRTTL